MNGVPPEDIAASRSRTYWLLSDVYLHRPDAGCMERVRVALGDSAPAVPEAAGDIFDGLRETLHAIGDERLLVEHTRLFGGLREGYGPPPPFESVHRQSRVPGDITTAVLRAYAAAGFGIIHAGAGPQDHLGVELRFMALAAHDELEAWRRGDDDAAIANLARQGAFLEQHLRAWVPGYCRRLAEQAREPFYTEIAKLTGRVIEDDHALVSAMLADAAA